MTTDDKRLQPSNELDPSRATSNGRCDRHLLADPVENVVEFRPRNRLVLQHHGRARPTVPPESDNSPAA
jgi:hypothetical protein